jgi:uncharacterized membrane protein
MRKNSEIRTMASRSLRGKWGRYILAILATIVIQSLVSSLVLTLANNTFHQSKETIIDYLLEYFIFFALTIGLNIMALFVIRQREIHVSDIFLVFDKRYYVPFLLLNLLSALINYLISFIVFLPQLAFSGFNQYLSMILDVNRKINFNWDFFQTSLSFVIGMIVSAILFMFVSQLISGLFQFAIYLRYDHAELTIFQSIKGAWHLMRKHIGQYILLQLSLLGWMILGTFAFIIGLLWALTYANAANAAFYQALIEKDNEPILSESTM